jgi:ribose transport system permease protein
MSRPNDAAIDRRPVLADAGADPAADPRTPPGVDAPPPRRGPALRGLGVRGAGAVVLVALIWLTVPQFGTVANITNIVLQMSVIGIVATGLTFVTLSGNFFALSTGTTAAFSALCFAKLVSAGFPDLLAGVVALLIGAGVGIAQGALVAVGGNPIVVSLGTAAALTGLISIVSAGVSVPWTTDLHWLAAKYAATYALVALIVVASLVLRFTAVGRRLLLSGASRAAATNTGISVRRSTILAFMLFGTTCAIAGLLQAARFGEVVSANYTSLDLSAVAAVLIGGTAVGGGNGSVLRSLFGALFISIVANIAILKGWSSGWQQVFVGLAVVAVVAALAGLRAAHRPARRAS